MTIQSCVNYYLKSKSFDSITIKVNGSFAGDSLLSSTYTLLLDHEHINSDSVYYFKCGVTTADGLIYAGDSISFFDDSSASIVSIDQSLSQYVYLNPPLHFLYLNLQGANDTPFKFFGNGITVVDTVATDCRVRVKYGNEKGHLIYEYKIGLADSVMHYYSTRTEVSGMGVQLYEWDFQYHTSTTKPNIDSLQSFYKKHYTPPRSKIEAPRANELSIEHIRQLFNQLNIQISDSNSWHMLDFYYDTCLPCIQLKQEVDNHLSLLTDTMSLKIFAINIAPTSKSRNKKFNERIKLAFDDNRFLQSTKLISGFPHLVVFHPKFDYIIYQQSGFDKNFITLLKKKFYYQ